MPELNPQQLLQLVQDTHIASGDERVRAITHRIVSDLFRTIDQLDVSADEFWAAADWLTRLAAGGQVGLITAGLGFDRLLDIRADEADRRAGRIGGTPRAIEGPLFVPGAPTSKGEARLDEGGEQGRVYVMEGVVRDLRGNAVPHACIDIWHANEQGGYSHFFPGTKPFELRRRIEAEKDGSYRFRTALPPGYAIPPNSPTAELFDALGRHGRRPAHIHFLVVAPGKRTLTTQINIPGDEYLQDDFAFATRDELVVELEGSVPPAGYESLGISAPFTRSRFDFVLQEATSEAEAQPLARMQRITG